MHWRRDCFAPADSFWKDGEGAPYGLGPRAGPEFQLGDSWEISVRTRKKNLTNSSGGKKTAPLVARVPNEMNKGLFPPQRREKCNHIGL